VVSVVSFIPAGRPAFSVLHCGPAQPENAGVFVASLDSTTAERLSTTRSRAVHAPGYLLFWREGALLAQAFDERTFDERTFEVGGNPVAVANAVGLNPVTNQGLFSVSDAGTLPSLDIREESIYGLLGHLGARAIR
jgi:hypothetical protein